MVLAAVKGNQPSLYRSIQEEFIPEESNYQINKGHGRIEKRRVTLCKAKNIYPDWPQLKTIIRVDCQRETKYKIEYSTRYYISSLTENATGFAKRIRNYWGVENKVHYVRDVTQGEDKSRIRTTPLRFDNNLLILLNLDPTFTKS
ncbi:ISAs1 family transposase [Anaplasma marginale]|uniref:ISAs1 family transposase n=1 Tax=Anaplasma marginale TaxID=770 RepID=UPI0011455929|nr:ISAs1 family transposase [Anaplasma marginale]